ncbi:MAG: hypothetical protein NXI04_20305 [Planctomycetaceae bacterium]|nr:hypothetical protein [Planctomycetaceae bacterium]
MTRRPIRLPRQRHQNKRRGTLFHYYMVYLFLSSVIMMTAGMCLHALLKADRVDTQNMARLHALQLLERSLRISSATGTFSMNGTSLQFMAGEQTTTWEVDNSLVRRTVRSDSEVIGRDRFVFEKGTTVYFEVDEGLVRCRIVDPPVMPDNHQPADDQLTSVEIVVARRSLKEASP